MRTFLLMTLTSILLAGCARHYDGDGRSSYRGWVYDVNLRPRHRSGNHVPVHTVIGKVRESGEIAYNSEYHYIQLEYAELPDGKCESRRHMIFWVRPGEPATRNGYRVKIDYTYDGKRYWVVDGGVEILSR